MIPTLEQAKTWNQLQGQLFCDNMRRASTVLVPQAVMLWLAWGTAPIWLLIALAVSILLLHGWRILIIRRGLRRTATDEQWDQLCQSISLVTALHGIWIGLAAALLLPYIGPQWGIGLSVIILGIQAGSIATLSVFPRAFWSFGLPILIGFTVGWYRVNPELVWLIGVLYFLLMLVLMGAVKNGYAVLRQSWELRTERNQALAEAEEANRQKTRFLSAASHDLRQPAAALGFMAEELNDRELPADLRPIATNIQRSSENIRLLLDKLFDLSRLDTPLISNSPRWCSLTKLAQNLSANMESRAKAKGLELSIDEIDGFVWADPTHIQRMLSNLLDNGLKYTDSGSVTLQMKPFENELRLSVIDTGRGIDAEHLQQVWDERMQGSDITGNQNEFSLGLGMSIVNRLAHVMNARTEIESEPGSGTTVHITIPANLYSPDKNEPIADSTMQGKMACAEGKRILLVEDNPDVREALGRHLHRLGFEVDLAESADSARKKLSAVRDYAILITDYRLPNNEVGTSLINFANSGGNQMTCLLISADRKAQEIETDAKVSGFLRKPVQTYELRRILMQLLDPDNVTTTGD